MVGEHKAATFNPLAASSEERESHRQAVDRMLSEHESRAAAAVERVLRAQIDAVASRVEQGESWDGAVTDAPMLDALADACYRPAWEQFTRAAYVAVEDGVKQIRPEQFDTWEALLRALIESVGAEHVTRINEYTRSQITRLLAIAAEEGIGAVAAGRQLVNDLGELTPARALRIARTELGIAANTATHEGTMSAARDLGVTLTKYWISTPDERRRDWHAGIQPVDAEAPFVVPDPEFGTVEMMHPLAAGAPASQVVNCRCTVSYREKR